MDALSNRQERHVDAFEFLLFHLGTFVLAVAADQIIRIKRRVLPDPDSPGRRLDIKKILQITPDTSSGVVLEIVHPSGQTEMKVDAVEGTVLLTLDQIQKLPYLIELHNRHPALWGLAVLGGRIVFLLDPSLLKTEENDPKGYFP